MFAMSGHSTRDQGPIATLTVALATAGSTSLIKHFYGPYKYLLRFVLVYCVFLGRPTQA